MAEMIRVHTISLGCPKNRVDTECMLGQLGAAYVSAGTPEEADLVLINTCAFIQPAVEESVQTILQIAHDLRHSSQRPLMAVTGCLPARYGVNELARELPEVDLWLSLEDQDGFAQSLSEHFNVPPSGQRRLVTTGPGFAYLKISEGCEHRCAFCTIPTIRGPLRSIPRQELADEASRLEEHGVRELCLVAQDLTAYGRDLGWKKNGLIPLLDSLLQSTGVEWIRPMYMYPSGVTRELLRFIHQSGGRILPYIDVPLQHAHPDILRTMGRPFVGDPRRVVDRIRSELPHACLRTSLIVGYPGETDQHFRSMLALVREAKFWHLGVFCFSPEEGTVAHGLPGQVPEEIKEQRREELMQVQAEISKEAMSQWVDQRIQVLVDAPEPEWPGLFRGRTWFQAPEVDGISYVSSLQARAGDMVWAEVVDSMTYDLSTLALEED